MKISDELDLIRGDLPGCRSVVYADLSSGLVLSVSSARRKRQEELDALCTRARALFKDFALPSGGAPASALDLGLDASLACVRTPGDGEEVLCCEGSVGMDVGRFLDLAQVAFGRIDGGR